ncbi:hypothetical protein K435DRAFT_798138 [Dendrothele bispora CBS 962.96]|uniref:Uncharacterized protein n=1 Tax=Dendrothele bispora (strain CBS 962.96) TaxID=1314807 RepID=A0A4S8M0L2_DENBC|nr:hypothetical protein K435DRAFT_798138 [Dendrothele bispora CBS 962.96]
MFLHYPNHPPILSPRPSLPPLSSIYTPNFSSITLPNIYFLILPEYSSHWQLPFKPQASLDNLNYQTTPCRNISISLPGCFSSIHIGIAQAFHHPLLKLWSLITGGCSKGALPLALDIEVGDNPEVFEGSFGFEKLSEVKTNDFQRNTRAVLRRISERHCGWEVEKKREVESNPLHKPVATARESKKTSSYGSAI